MITGGAVSATGDVTGGTVITGGAVSATGDVTGGNFTAIGNIRMTATGGSFLELPSATTDPAGAVAGSIYYNSTTQVVRLRNNTTWVNL